MGAGVPVVPQGRRAVGGRQAERCSSLPQVRHAGSDALLRAMVASALRSELMT